MSSAGMNLTLKVWRQASPDAKGEFRTYNLPNVSEHMSFLEMLDVLNQDHFAGFRREQGIVNHFIHGLMVSASQKFKRPGGAFRRVGQTRSVQVFANRFDNFCPVLFHRRSPSLKVSGTSRVGGWVSFRNLFCNWSAQ